MHSYQVAKGTDLVPMVIHKVRQLINQESSIHIYTGLEQPHRINMQIRYPQG